MEMEKNGLAGKLKYGEGERGEGEVGEKEEGGDGEEEVGKEEEGGDGEVLTRLILKRISLSSEITFIVTGKSEDTTELSVRAGGGGGGARGGLNDGSERLTLIKHLLSNISRESAVSLLSSTRPPSSTKQNERGGKFFL